jgi:hypothetical protein
MDARVILNLFHILAVAPLFLWVGISRTTIPTWVYGLLFFLGLVLVVYHGYKAYVRILQKSTYAWVNLVHALIVGPLLLYIGAMKKDTPRAAYEGLLLVGFAALGYHLYELAMYHDFA